MDDEQLATNKQRPNDLSFVTIRLHTLPLDSARLDDFGRVFLLDGDLSSVSRRRAKLHRWFADAGFTALIPIVVPWGVLLFFFGVVQHVLILKKLREFD